MRFYQLLLPILMGLHFKISQGLVTYQSTLPLNATDPDAGLKLIKESIKKETNFEKGTTICLRFNFLALGKIVLFSFMILDWLLTGKPLRHKLCLMHMQATSKLVSSLEL